MWDNAILTNFFYRVILSHYYSVTSLKFVEWVNLYVWKKLSADLKNIKLLRKCQCVLISEMWQIKKKKQQLQINMINQVPWLVKYFFLIIMRRKFTFSPFQSGNSFFFFKVEIVLWRFLSSSPPCCIEMRTHCQMEYSGVSGRQN